ncbi:type IV-A pilus assembly ATPase PilB [Ketobacter alkanivorans]|uniref:Type IV-A pilus assembly ATPase PilB n=1 Tax=Ketobacter alkanivorans TaxID=1917421 RepID=A0A2K9LP12_9GAMM|nr:type IV-A pilus assembly ATPase PilB [Ketobacter alkanivorans]AUM14109.1 type IV-A pilus assembly ATPase PilB [Ketobacter alkanivorans]
MNLSGLAKKLLNEGVIAEDAIRSASETAHKQKIPLVTYLVQNNLVPARTIALAASDEFGTPLIELDSMSQDAYPKELVNEKLVRKHRALPLFKRGTRLYVAVSDPTNLQALDEIKFNTGLSTEAVVVDEDKLDGAIDRYLEGTDTGFSDLGDTDLDDLDIEAGTDDDKGPDVTAEAADDAPIVRFVNKILLDAIKMGASDIHFEPYEKAYRIRLRADGILREVARPPVNLAPKLAARLKVMSQLDISERRLPQDGRIKLKLSKTRAIDFRVNSLPTLFGEKIVLRILDPDSAKLGIDMLGYEEDQKDLFMKALEQPQGMILVTGPTGSGKTVSLYTGLNILNTPERNISTAEDPAEINLEGINQVNVNTKVGLDFGAALRAFLRQDPDIVMVGEIRDLETAEIAIKAAQTGHLVLSTLHTNSAPETLTRLRNMGVPAFNIATSVSLIIAQRLARRLCKSCKKPIDVPKETLIAEGFKEGEIGSFTIYGPHGCDKCVNGYKGRVGIYEVVKVTDGISRIIMEEGNAIQIADAARAEGFNDLRASGLKKVKDGLTSLAEVNRVTTGH